MSFTRTMGRLFGIFHETDISVGIFIPIRTLKTMIAFEGEMR